MSLIRADLHSHTIFSPDAMTTPDEYVRRAVRAGITCVAVTEHNTIDGSLYLRSIAPFKVIVAEEVRTVAGEIIGFFLTETVPAGLTPEETIARIKAQGGLTCAPHPLDPFRQGLGEAALLRLLPQIDIIEAFNGRIRLPRHNERARRLATAHDVPMSAGTDAHSPWEMGRTWVEMPDFETPAQFLASLRQGRIVGRRSAPHVYALTAFEKLRRKLAGRPALPPLPETAGRR